MPAPSATPLDPRTRMGPVTLVVADRGRALDFYGRVLGLDPVGPAAEVQWLGQGARPLVGLVERPGARRVRGTTGLYHFALLVPGRAELGHALRRLLEERVRLQGAADHRVSEALYLADPDGHGIEIYRDRPRAQWTRGGHAIEMTTDPLDLDAILAAGDEAPPPADTPPGLPPGTVMGHVHLHVADIAAAEAFYRERVGFDLTLRYGPMASFLSAGGYHHHLGMNTWAGVGAPPPPPDALRLVDYAIELPDAAELERVRARLAAAGDPLEESATGLLARDPSGHVARFVVAAA